MVRIEGTAVRMAVDCHVAALLGVDEADIVDGNVFVALSILSYHMARYHILSL